MVWLVSSIYSLEPREGLFVEWNGCGLRLSCEKIILWVKVIKSLDKSYLAIPPNISTVCIHIYTYIYIHIYIRTIGIEGSLEVKLLTIWTDEKQRWEESEKRSEEERRSQERKSQKKEDPGARKCRKVAKPFLFPMICGSGGSEPAGQMRWKIARCCGAKHICKWKS